MEQAREEESQEKEQSSLVASRAPSADRIRPISRQNSKVDLKHSKSTFRIVSNTGQQFFRETNTQSFAQLKTVERIHTAKSNANEGEMRRTRVLMDKISGKHMMESRARIETIEESQVRRKTI
jgi:hypothetical protein